MKIKDLIHQDKTLREQQKEITKRKKELAKLKEAIEQYRLLSEIEKQEMQQDTVDITNIVIINYHEERIYAKKVLDKDDKNGAIYIDYYWNYINIFSEETEFRKMEQKEKRNRRKSYSLYFDKDDIPTRDIEWIQKVSEVHPELKAYTSSQVPRTVLYQLYLQNNEIDPKSLRKFLPQQ